MKRSETLQIADAFREYLDEEPEVHERLLETQAQKCLPLILGDVSKYISQSSISNGILYLQIYSASVARGIVLGKTSLITRINEYIGAELLRDIVIK